jgi:hypothetical protein
MYNSRVAEQTIDLTIFQASDFQVINTTVGHWHFLEAEYVHTVCLAQKHHASRHGIAFLPAENRQSIASHSMEVYETRP